MKKVTVKFDTYADISDFLNINTPKEDVMIYIDGGIRRNDWGESPLDYFSNIPNTQAVRNAVLSHFNCGSFQELRKYTKKETGIDYPSWNDWLQENWLNKLLVDFEDCISILHTANLILYKEFYKEGRSVYIWTLPESCAKITQATIEYVNGLLDGEIYGYVIEEGEECNLGHVHWKEIDSCCGFVGSDVTKNGMMDAIPKDLHDMLLVASNSIQY